MIRFSITGSDSNTVLLQIAKVMKNGSRRCNQKAKIVDKSMWMIPSLVRHTRLGGLLNAASQVESQGGLRWPVNHRRSRKIRPILSRLQNSFKNRYLTRGREGGP